MDLYLAIVVFIVSMALLIKSSDWFTEKAELVGKYLGIPGFIIGVTIVAMGTSMPELASAFMSVINHASEIVPGNVIGSNIANILLILGISAMFLKKDTKIKWDLFHGDITFIIASTLFLGVVIWDGMFSVFEATLLFASYVVYFIYNYDIHKNKNGNASKRKRSKRERVKVGAIDVIILLVSIVLIAISADYLIKSALDIAVAFDIGAEILGLTAVAIGTSLPELAVSISAVRRGNIEMALGNVSGSNIFNTFVVMSLPMLAGGIAIPATLISQSYPFLLIATAMFLSIILDHRLHKFEGAMLFMLYLFFIVETII